MGTLTGKCVVVTGAGRGLGRAYAMAVAQAGGHVVVNDIDGAEAAAVCQEIAARGGKAILSNHDVSDAASAAAMVQLCTAEFGRMDGLVNNAAVCHMAAPAEEDAARARRLIEVNVIGVLNCGLAAIRVMSRQGHGTIVNIVSGAALGFVPGFSTYGASKGAVLALTRCWAADLAGSGVHVVAVSPVADTRMTRDADSRISPSEQPEEIAPLVVHLLGGGATGLAGEVVRLAYGELSVYGRASVGQPLGKQPTWNVEGIAKALAGWGRDVVPEKSEGTQGV